MIDVYFYASQALVLFVVALWINGGRKMKKKKMKNEISSEIVDDEYKEDDQAHSGQRVVSPPSAPLPIKNEDEQIFNDWMLDWEDRFQYFSDPNIVANQPAAVIKNKELVILIGLAHNTDVLIEEQRKTNKLLRDLIKSQEE